MPDIFLRTAPALGRLLNHSNRTVYGIQKLSAEVRHPALVKSRRLNEFRFGIGVIDQAHPMARLAACMTSSCVRPTTASAENSWSR